MNLVRYRSKNPKKILAPALTRRGARDFGFAKARVNQSNGQVAFSGVLPPCFGETLAENTGFKASPPKALPFLLPLRYNASVSIASRPSVRKAKWRLGQFKCIIRTRTRTNTFPMDGCGNEGRKAAPLSKNKRACVRCVV